MFIRVFLALLAASLSLSLLAEEKLSLEYYFSDLSAYSTDTPTPESVLGYQVGEWHVRPEQLVQYYQELASKSDRVKVKVIGFSHERRPLILAFISSA